MLYNPTKRTFPPISVTGRNCALSCSHCQGVYLRHMIPATPETLYDLCTQETLNGILLSGGFTREGKVPLIPFLPAVRKIKEERKILINAHTGFVSEKEAKMLGKARIDCVSFDFVTDESVIRNVYGLSSKPREYVRTMEILSRDLTVAPHLCIGLNYGKDSGELKALDILSEMTIEKLVLLVLKPTAGTPMENVEIDRDHLFTVFEKASEFPNVSLGCMRPHDEEIERRAAALGFDIARPSFVRGRKKNLCCVS